MNILSVFDGMSCGRIALDRAGIKVDKYYASEIDKYSIRIAQKNYPDTIQLGDINEWRSWKLPKIDLFIGGSPCQGFSFAGKGLNFDDPRSRLFFVYVDILKRLRRRNPELLFLLENVKMKKAHQDVITEYLGVDPILIDSALVSAQSRKRLYWTNIPNVGQPEDRGILLRDILENDVPDEFILSSEALKYMDRNVRDGRNHWDFAHYSDTANDKSAAVVANFYKGVPYNVLKDNRTLKQVGSLYAKNADAGRVYSPDGLARTLKGESGGMGGKMGLYDVDGVIRRLTPVECERLQTAPDKYTEGVSNTQRYKMLGNGWTVDVIAHILKCTTVNIKTFANQT